LQRLLGPEQEALGVEFSQGDEIAAFSTLEQVFVDHAARYVTRPEKKTVTG